MALRLPAPLTPLWPQLKVAYTQATRVASPLTRQLSRLRGGYLPRAAVATVDESIADAGGRVWQARPKETVRLEIPAGHPPRHPKFVSESELVAPRLAVAELPDARMLGQHRVVVDRRDRMIEELGLYWGTDRWSEHQVFWHPFPGPPLEVEGRLGVLAGRGDLSYYHWLLDIVPRLALLETPGIPTPDRWYVPLGQSFQREVLGLMGFPIDRVLDADRSPHVRADQLLVPGLPDTHNRISPWSVDYIRKCLRPPDVQLVPGRRIYVTRGNQRHNRIVINEEAVLEILGERGFTVVDPGSLAVSEQIRAFAEAEWIVGPHGAAMTNLAFASPGAAVLEFFAPDYLAVYYWKLVECLPEVSYHYLVGVGRQPRPGRWETGVMSDITVDLDALSRALDTESTAASR